MLSFHCCSFRHYFSKSRSRTGTDLLISWPFARFGQDGSRRRTPGGVFLYLLRNDDEVPMEQIRQIFAEENKTREKFKRVVRARRRQAHAHALKQSLQSTPTSFPHLPT